MKALLERVAGHLGVEAGGDGDDGGVGTLDGQRLAIVGVAAQGAPAGDAAHRDLVDIRDADPVDGVEVAEHARMVAAHHAEPDQQYSGKHRGRPASSKLLRAYK